MPSVLINGGGDAPLSQRTLAGLRLGGGLAVDDWVDTEVMAAVNEGGNGGGQGMWGRMRF